MTRNDAYKAARHAWRLWHRRGLRDFTDAMDTAMRELSMQGASQRDKRMVRLWIKAFASGRRWPTEAELLAAEKVIP